MSSEDAGADSMDVNDVGLNERLADIEQRIEELSWRMDRLANQVAQLSYKQETDAEPEPQDVSDDEPAATQPVAAAPPAPNGEPLSVQISPGLVTVIQLIARGDAEAAQQRLYQLPEQELSGQPAVVALVAAALFVQRGDYAAGLKAISRARQLTDNPRLITLTKLIEKQASC